VSVNQEIDMATVSEFTSLVNLFVEALQVLQADKSEVVAAQEALAAAQAALAKEEGDVGGSTTSLQAAWDAVKAAGDGLVADLIGFPG
jgi:ribosomal protein L7/L12